MRITMPKLKSFSSPYEPIENFLRMNPQLIDISIINCNNVGSRIIRSIARYNPLIENLVFKSADNEDDFSESLEYFKQLTALKSLKMNCRFNRISPVISELAQASIPLECLSLFEFNSDEGLMRGIADLKKLRKLSLIFTRGMNMLDVLGYVTELSELTHLKLSKQPSNRQ